MREEIFAPLGMRETGFLLKVKRDNFVKTEITKERGQVWGNVHDETAWQMGGLAGHAGLFSTLDDLAHFSSFYLTTASPLVAGLFDYDCFERTLAWIRWQKGRRFLWHSGFTGPGLGLDLENGRAWSFWPAPFTPSGVTRPGCWPAGRRPILFRRRLPGKKTRIYC